MKYLIKALLIILIPCSCSPPMNQETVNYEGETILVGPLDWEGLTSPPYETWFNEYYLDYRVDTASLATLGTGLNDVEIIMFLGTWCSDSQVQVPQFYKILDHVGYDISRMTVYGLEQLESEELVSAGGYEKNYDVSFVPTMIFLRDGREIGRITEYPELTLERDLAKISQLY